MDNDNNPKATDPGLEMGAPDSMFTDRPAFKRNKPEDPMGSIGGEKYPADGVKSA